MTKKISTILFLLIFSVFLYSCEKPATEPKEKIPRFITKEIEKSEIIDLNEEKLSASFTITARAEAKNHATIISQTSGQITELHVKVGDLVMSKQILAKIGNSLASDVNESQINSINESLSLTEKSRNISEQALNIGIESARIAKDSAFESYSNAQKQLKTSKDIYKTQHKSLNINYKNARNALFDAEDALELLKNTTNEIEKIKSMENQIDTLYTAYKQSSLALEQLEKAQKAQEDQLNFAIQIAENQYKISEEQYKNTILSTQSQDLSISSQELQIQSNKELLEINKKYNKITSPIKGIVSEIYISKNSFVGNGQQILKIEAEDEIIFKTSVNESELKQITLNDEVEILRKPELKGKISSISPVPNKNSKKTEIEISFKNNKDLKIGKSEQLVFKSTKENSSIFIPLNAVSINSEKLLVKVIGNRNFVEEKEVETGDVFGNQIEIISGLTGEEIIIKKGNTFIEKGHKAIIK